LNMSLFLSLKSKYHKKMIRLLLGVIITLFFTLYTLGYISIPGLHFLEQKLYDTKVKVSAQGSTDDRVVILDIDEKSLGEFGRWPWNRSLMAKINQKLFDEQRIAVLGYDIVWAEPDPLNFSSISRLYEGFIVESLGVKNLIEQMKKKDPDQQFADSIKGHNVVLSLYFNSEKNAVKANVLPPPALMAGQLPSHTHQIIHWEAYTGNLEKITASAAMAGHFNPIVDSDGTVRKLPLLVEYGGNFYQSLSLAMVRMAIGGPAIKPIIVKASSDYEKLEGIEIGPLQIPLQEDASAFIPYRGGAYTYRYISVSELLNNHLPPKSLENKLVLMGSSAPGLRDQRATPMASVYPGIEIHANMISGMLNREIRTAPAYTLALALMEVVILSILLTILLPMLGALWSTIATIMFMFMLVGFNYLCWQSMLVIPLASPLLSLFFIFLSNIGIGYFFEGRLQKQMTNLFGQYVPPQLVKKMAESPEKYGMQGQESDMTVLFSDIRGFTSISEKLTPLELTSYINEYFNTMTEIIMQQSGTLDKYIGDAIMAFWGAPVETKLHASQAIHTTFKLRDAAYKLAQSFEKRGLPKFNIGIGLNSGKMRVGDMGSRLRRSYTVMGDPVNLGSRLEGLTKVYGVDILVSEFVVERAPEFLYRQIDMVRVKGKSDVVAIYEPVIEMIKANQDDINEVKEWSSALKSYFKQDWKLFESKLMQLRKHYPKRYVYQVYEQRLSLFKKNPPPKSWDGVHNFETK
jgi:adenylate cyclase